MDKIRAKKEFGQNFLIDQNIIQKIINVIKPENQNIVEIGPGQGAITKFLLEKANKVLAYEIDKDMISILQEKFSKYQNFELQNVDFLKTELPFDNSYQIVGNIPYNITTDILFKLFEHRHIFKKVVLMVQKEYAERLVARVNTFNYSKLTVTANYLANVKIECFVSKQCFFPAPKVDSAIISLEFFQNQDDDYEILKDFFKTCFLFKRKKLIHSLVTKYSKEKILKTFKNLAISENIRIQQLNLEQILAIYKSLK